MAKMTMRVTVLALAVLAAGCSAAGAGDPGPTITIGGSGGSSSTSTSVVSPPECPPPPITTPTLPEQIPGYTEVDPATGLHVTGTPIEVDLSTYRLEVTGRVERPLSLTYDELRCLPKVEASPELVCPGYFVDVACWAGAPLREVLEAAGASNAATFLRLLSADGYSQSIELSEDLLAAAFLAYELEGDPLPILHGFPVRFVWPGHSGNDWVKWLVAIEVG
ncbi:MAG TPA: molybdopterin-dependent oxidoreductase [Acidimicrobiia bacterium]|nr:molybdopterin-dependent oxidoreductase [Acidimicrobiia bacterium]